jgi:hypothetical protein
VSIHGVVLVTQYLYLLEILLCVYSKCRTIEYGPEISIENWRVSPMTENSENNLYKHGP